MVTRIVIAGVLLAGVVQARVEPAAAEDGPARCPLCTEAKQDEACSQAKCANAKCKSKCTKSQCTKSDCGNADCAKAKCDKAECSKTACATSACSKSKCSKAELTAAKCSQGKFGKSCNDSTCRRCGLAETGLSPYRIEPPDVLSIKLTGVELKCNSARRCSDGELNAKDLQVEQVVGPDGRIAGCWGGIFVAGMTVDEIQNTIQEAIGEFGDCDDVEVEVKQRNSKVVYLIHDQGAGDSVLRLPCEEDSTLRDVVRAAVWSQPVDLSQCKIEVRRPSVGFGQLETVFPVAWTEIADDPASEENVALLPGDRVFVAESREACEAKPAAAHPAQIAPSQFMFKVQVIEDRGENLVEIESLDERMITGDSRALLGAVKIATKNKLVTIVADPTLVTTVGREATLRLDGESNDCTELTVKAAMRGESLQVDCALRIAGRRDLPTIEMDVAALVEEGQTLIIPARTTAKAYDVAPAKFYVVITPERVGRN